MSRPKLISIRSTVSLPPETLVLASRVHGSVTHMTRLDRNLLSLSLIIPHFAAVRPMPISIKMMRICWISTESVIKCPNPLDIDFYGYYTTGHNRMQFRFSLSLILPAERRLPRRPFSPGDGRLVIRQLSLVLRRRINLEYHRISGRNPVIMTDQASSQAIWAAPHRASWQGYWVLP